MYANVCDAMKRCSVDVSTCFVDTWVEGMCVMLHPRSDSVSNSHWSCSGGCAREGVWKGERQCVAKKRLVGARDKRVVSGVEQCETCAEGGLTHQPTKDSAALLRVRAVQVCISQSRQESYEGSYRRTRTGRAEPVQSGLTSLYELVVSHLMDPHACSPLHRAAVGTISARRGRRIWVRPSITTPACRASRLGIWDVAVRGCGGEGE